MLVVLATGQATHLHLILLGILQQQVLLLLRILLFGADTDVADDLHRPLKWCGKKKGGLMASFYHIIA